MGRRSSDLEKLPPYVSAYTDRHGKRRYRFRKTGQPPHTFKAHPGTPKHPSQEYKLVVAGLVPANDSRRATPGTIEDLVQRFYASGNFQKGNKTTQNKNRRAIDRFRAEHGNKRVSTIRFNHVEAMVIARAVRTLDENGKQIGGPFAAELFRKLLRRLFELAVRLGTTDVPGYAGINVNPVELAETPATPKTKGFHTWTDDEIEQFRDFHPVGTKARMVLELLRWTMQRGDDARLFSPKQRRNGQLELWNEKVDKHTWMPEPRQLTEAIEALPAIGIETILVNEYGRPFSQKGFGNWFKKQCVRAGLPHCSAHGLRKSTARQLTDHVGATQQELKAAGGWSGDQEVSTYVADANQKKLAGGALDRLAEWDRVNQGPKS